MKRAGIRDLRYRFSAVEDLLRDGEEIHITKRRRVIARLLPPDSSAPATFPDFLARQKKTFGKKRMKVFGAWALERWMCCTLLRRWRCERVRSARLM